MNKQLIAERFTKAARSKRTKTNSGQNDSPAYGTSTFSLPESD